MRISSAVVAAAGGPRRDLGLGWPQGAYGVRNAPWPPPRDRLAGRLVAQGVDQTAKQGDHRDLAAPAPRARGRRRGRPWSEPSVL